MNKLDESALQPLNEFSRDTFIIDDEFKLTEAKGDDVDGKHIIAKVEGTFFVPDGFSRNNRFYSKALWEKVLNDDVVKNRLQTRRMLGTVGHDLPIDDKAVREGMISHVVTNLAINESDGRLKGQGTALILDTPAGRSLNTLLRAGCKIFTSSRAYGKYQGQEKGVPKVDEASYKFDTFDFVLDPGFIEANPKLVEGLEINNTENLDQQGDNMDTELLEKVVKQNAEAQVNLTKAMNDLRESNEKLANAEKSSETLKAKISELEAAHKAAADKGAAHEGSAKEFQGKHEAAEAELAKYRELGAPEKISEALDVAKGLLDQYKVLGTPGEVDRALEESMKTIKAYKDLGTPKQIDEALEGAQKLLEKYKEFGTVEEIGKVFDKVSAMANKMKGESFGRKVTDLAKDLGVHEAAVKTLMEKKLTDSEIRAVLGNVSESTKIAEKFKKQPAEAEKPVVVAENKVERKGPLFEDSTTRLMSSFGAYKK